MALIFTENFRDTTAKSEGFYCEKDGCNVGVTMNQGTFWMTMAHILVEVGIAFYLI